MAVDVARSRCVDNDGASFPCVSRNSVSRKDQRDEIDDASIIKATNARTVYSDGKVVKGAVIKENHVLPIPGESVWFWGKNCQSNSRSSQLIHHY